MRRGFRFLLATCLVVLCGPATALVGQGVERYIVVLHPGGTAPAQAAAEAARNFGGRVGFIYEHAIRGFSIELPAPAAAALRNNPRIAYVEADRPVQIFALTVPTGVERIFADSNSGIGINGADDYRVDVDVAVIDTGIDYQHPDLNVVNGTNCTYLRWSFPWTFSAYCVDGLALGDDDHYHGTHVAGTIGALDNGDGVVGVAPGARLWSVKVLDSSGSGYTSSIVAGIDWVAAHASEIEVANMSLGGSGYSQSEYDAIQGAVNSGVAFAVAAGNDNDDASNYSPAAFDNVLTVSALADFNGAPGGGAVPTCRSDQDDTLADFSNWGPAVNIAGPGVCIYSTFPLEKGEYGTISGTSMASPHAAGALALLASSNKPSNASEVFELYSQLEDAGNFDWADDSGDGIKEPLLDVTGFVPTLIATGSGGGGGTTNLPPTASFTFNCTGLTCTFDGSGSSDPDGSIDSWNWNFGDGTTGSGPTISHAFTAAETFNVSLTVTDDDGATDQVTKEVTVSQPSVSTITLTANLTALKKRFKVALNWKGAVSSDVDIYRNGDRITTTVNSGSYTDSVNSAGISSLTYKVCEVGTATCSNEVQAYP